MEKPVCLVSGGLDSYLTWWITKARPIFINYGQPYLDRELESISRLYDDVEIIDINGLPAHAKRYIPCRNLMFCTLVSCFDCDGILISGMDDDIDIDKSPEEFLRMSEVISRHANRRIIVESPWWGYSKSSAVRKYLDSGGDPQSLINTYSCYKSEKCHQCDACYRWGIALLSNKISVRPPSLDCIIARGIEQLWHRPIERLTELRAALDFTSTGYRVLDVNDFEQINSGFLEGDLMIVNIKSKIGGCTDAAHRLRNKGYLFHGVVPFGE